MTALCSTIFNRLEENYAAQSNRCAKDRSRCLQPESPSGDVVASAGSAYARSTDKASARADNAGQYRYEVFENGSGCERIRSQSHGSAAHTGWKACQKVKEIPMPRAAAVLLLTALAAPAINAQQPASSSDTGPDNPSEAYKLQHSCSNFKGLVDCGQELFTGQPVHIAVGSIAAQNGFGVGLAYVGHKTTENWRVTWDSDAVASDNGSWRAGLYLKFVNTYEK